MEGIHDMAIQGIFFTIPLIISILLLHRLVSSTPLLAPLSEMSLFCPTPVTDGRLRTFPLPKFISQKQSTFSKRASASRFCVLRFHAIGLWNSFEDSRIRPTPPASLIFIRTCRTHPAERCNYLKKEILKPCFCGPISLFHVFIFAKIRPWFPVPMVRPDYNPT